MLKKFDEEVSKIILETKNIIVESNGFQYPDELLEEIYDVKGYHDFDEFKPNGKRRLELGVLIIQLRALSEMLGDEQFSKDLNDLDQYTFTPDLFNDDIYKYIQMII